MAKTTGLAKEQLRALDRLKRVAGVDRFYLAGASAIIWHLGHRRSADLDLFSTSARVNLDRLRLSMRKVPGIEVVAATDVMLELDVSGTPVDLVKYPYPPLDPLRPGPRGVPVASLRDLAAMKLSAIARRGIRRDFWDLYVILHAGVTLVEAAAAYRERFGRSDSDLYHVQRALTWFEDAERDPLVPSGLTPALWRKIREYFLRESVRLLEL